MCPGHPAAAQAQLSARPAQSDLEVILGHQVQEARTEIPENRVGLVRWAPQEDRESPAHQDEKAHLE